MASKLCYKFFKFPPGLIFKLNSKFLKNYYLTKKIFHIFLNLLKNAYNNALTWAYNIYFEIFSHYNRFLGENDG